MATARPNRRHRPNRIPRGGELEGLIDRLAEGNLPFSDVAELCAGECAEMSEDLENEQDPEDLDDKQIRLGALSEILSQLGDKLRWAK